MALSKAKELRELSDDEISTEIANIKRELFDLRFKKATRQMESGFHEFRHNRRKLAQLMTIARERELAVTPKYGKKPDGKKPDSKNKAADASAAEEE